MQAMPDEVEYRPMSVAAEGQRIFRRAAFQSLHVSLATIIVMPPLIESTEKSKIFYHSEFLAYAYMP